MQTYLSSARPAYTLMREEQLAACDYVIDGTKDTDEIVNEAIEIITGARSHE